MIINEIVKVLTNLTRFMSAVAFAKFSQAPHYYIPLGMLAIFFGVTEALIGFWKEIAARVLPVVARHPNALVQVDHDSYQRFGLRQWVGPFPHLDVVPLGVKDD